VDGKLSVWDLQHPAAPVFHTAAHADIINAVDGFGAGSESPWEVLTGGQDGEVHLWDVRATASRPVVRAKHRQGAACWALAPLQKQFGHSIHGWAAGFSNGDVWTFDLTAGAPYAVRNLSSPPESRSTSAATPLAKPEDADVGADGISSLDTVRVAQRDSGGGVGAAIVATLMSGKIFLASDASLSSIVEKNSNQNSLWCARVMPHEPVNGSVSVVAPASASSGAAGGAKHVPPGAVLFASSGGATAGSINLYNWAPSQPLQRLQRVTNAAPQSVITLAWSPDKRGLLAYISLDRHLRVGYFPALR
jgi:WD40 repeat protein